MKEYSIYGLYNPLEDNFFYVGMTSRPRERMLQHFSFNNRNEDSNGVIRGLEQEGLTPLFKILDNHIQTKEYALELELAYIKELKETGNPLANKYNIIPDRTGILHSKETKIGQSKNSPLRKTVIQLTKKGIIVNEFHSAREAGRVTNIDHRSISQVASGSEVRKSAGGFKWQYKK